MYSELVLLNNLDAWIAREFENVVEAELRDRREDLFSHTQALENVQQTRIMLNIYLDEIGHVSLSQVGVASGQGRVQNLLRYQCYFV